MVRKVTQKPSNCLKNVAGSLFVIGALDSLAFSKPFSLERGINSSAI
ncbi:unannotated protein [freshwater metagenome]|uniref:Unannotated protein n=1 Tax=freshwater metagenome TaxID=449393 RepID=A0A6J6HCB0_9ZZZZ